jgi:hypothetical protein
MTELHGPEIRKQYNSSDSKITADSLCTREQSRPAKQRVLHASEHALPGFDTIARQGKLFIKYRADSPNLVSLLEKAASNID